MVDGLVGRFQEPLCQSEPLGEQPLVRRRAGGLAEAAGELARAQRAAGGERRALKSAAAGRAAAPPTLWRRRIWSPGWPLVLTGVSTYWAWPPPRCGVATICRATRLAIAAP